MGHSRGRPHKELTSVDYLDFPNNASKKEQEKWQKRKNMERWRYAKKMGPDSHEFRQAESKQSLDYYYKIKNQKAQASQGSQGNASEEFVDVTEEVDPNGLDITDPSERSKELSRQR